MLLLQVLLMTVYIKKEHKLHRCLVLNLIPALFHEVQKENTSMMWGKSDSPTENRLQGTYDKSFQFPFPTTLGHVPVLLQGSKTKMEKKNYIWVNSFTHGIQGDGVCLQAAPTELLRAKPDWSVCFYSSNTFLNISIFFVLSVMRSCAHGHCGESHWTFTSNWDWQLR